MTEKTKASLHNKFRQFLKEKEVFALFTERVKEEANCPNLTIYMQRVDKTFGPREYPTGAFIWPDDEIEYWKSFHEEWNSIVDKYLGPRHLSIDDTL